MVDVNSYYSSNSNSLKAGDLPPGKEVPVIIAGVEEGTFDDDNKGKVKKLILKFENKEKGLVLNKTNSTTIAAAYGPETDHWKGKKIFMYSTKVTFGDSLVDAIRVRAELEVAGLDDDIPF